VPAHFVCNVWPLVTDCEPAIDRATHFCQNVFSIGKNVVNLQFKDMENKDNITIRHPEAWELLVGIDGKRLDYILFTPSVENSLITGGMTVASSPDAPLQALEDTVYDTPLLLDEYKRVSVVVHSDHFVWLPGQVSVDDAVPLLRAAYPDDDGDVCVNHLPLNGVTLASLLPHGLKAFVDRTFNFPVIYHHLYALCEHFHGLNHGSTLSRVFLNLNADSMDMVIYHHGDFLCANSYRFTNADDAAYYALNAWRANELDQLTDELQLTGDRDMRAAMTPLLRQYVKYVMPAIYPAAAMRLGHNALQAPLILILQALQITSCAS